MGGKSHLENKHKSAPSLTNSPTLSLKTTSAISQAECKDKPTKPSYREEERLEKAIVFICSSEATGELKRRGIGK